MAKGFRSAAAAALPAQIRRGEHQGGLGAALGCPLQPSIAYSTVLSLTPTLAGPGGCLEASPSLRAALERSTLPFSGFFFFSFLSARSLFFIFFLLPLVTPGRAWSSRSAHPGPSRPGPEEEPGRRRLRPG